MLNVYGNHDFVFYAGKAGDYNKTTLYSNVSFPAFCAGIAETSSLWSSACATKREMGETRNP